MTHPKNNPVRQRSSQRMLYPKPHTITTKGSVIMSYKEMAKSLIDQIPDSKMYYIVAYLQGAAVPEEMPNAETIAAIEELENGGGTLFTGSTEALFAELMEE